MALEIVFLACSLTGAFAIGLGTAWLAFRRERAHWRDALDAANGRRERSEAEAERLRGRSDSLEQRLAGAVDPETHRELRRRHAELEAAYGELEQRAALGLVQDRPEADLRFMESFGVSITGEVPPEERDDLTRVRGISPYIADRLHAIGIRTFEQIARLEEEDVRRVNAAIELLPGRIRREDWVGQCRRMELARKGA